jgi:hypothetical protein
MSHVSCLALVAGRAFQLPLPACPPARVGSSLNYKAPETTSHTALPFRDRVRMWKPGIVCRPPTDSTFFSKYLTPAARRNSLIWGKIRLKQQPQHCQVVTSPLRVRDQPVARKTPPAPVY